MASPLTSSSSCAIAPSSSSSSPWLKRVVRINLSLSERTGPLLEPSHAPLLTVIQEVVPELAASWKHQANHR